MRCVNRMLVAAGVVAAAVAISAVATSTVTAAVPTPTVYGHNCNEMGADLSTEGVHCADLAYRWMGTYWDVWGVGQALCQRPSGALVQCAGIRQNVGLYDKYGSSWIRQANCGRYGGLACPADKRFQNGSPHASLRPSPGTCTEVWASMTNDYIVLPGFGWILGPGPNVASWHQKLCHP